MESMRSATKQLNKPAWHRRRHEWSRNRVAYPPNYRIRELNHSIRFYPHRVKLHVTHRWIKKLQN